jgi:hypothetical protein
LKTKAIRIFGPEREEDTGIEEWRNLNRGEDS